MKFVHRAFIPVQGQDKKIKVNIDGAEKVISLSPEQTYVDLDPANEGATITLSYSVDSEDFTGVISFIAGNNNPFRGSGLNMAAKLITALPDDVTPPKVEIPVVPPTPVVEPVISINTEPDTDTEPAPDPA